MESGFTGTTREAVRSRKALVSATVGALRKKRYMVEREAMMDIITTYQYSLMFPKTSPVIKLPNICDPI